MALILAGIVIVGTLVLVALIFMADMMSDAPSEQGTSIWPTLVIGFGIAALLAVTHWFHIPW